MTEPKDEFAGQGGSYVIGKDGVKRLEQRTAPPEIERPRAAQENEGQQAVKEPAATATDQSASAKPKK